MKKVITSSSTLLSGLIALVMMLASQSALAEYVKLTALDGTGGTGGEGYASLVDANVNSKMGHSFDPGNPERADAYIVVKAAKAVVPNFYFLVTGGDTGDYPTRNWKKWNIYGGNFESDADAKRGDVGDPAAAGWTLIDERDGEALPQANTEPANFQFNQADGTTAYQYFWIEILESVQGSDVWLQMAEWGLGTYGDFEKYLEDLANQETGTDEPIKYTIIDGDRNNSDNEGLPKLFDGDIYTKWGNGLTAKNYGETTNGAFFIVKTSRAIAPGYYKLVTGTDNASWTHRNWNTWQIYGIAAADAPNGKPTRDSDKWVLLDRKDNISEEQLPDKNSFTVIFNLSEENTEKYQYFKVEIDRIMSGDGYMQMSEFALGDEYTLALDRNAIVDQASFNPDAFAEKALLDKFAQAIEDVKACNDPFALGTLNETIDNLKGEIATSESQYAELITSRNQAINLIADDNLKAAAKAYAEAWISEDDAIATSTEYPAGNFAYIKANRQLTGAEAQAEAKRFSEYLTANMKAVDDPIYATYDIVIDANGFNDGEMGHSLIDGDRENTKWCANTSHKPWRIVFKSSEPIKPTYYGLVTGGDTNSYPDRNWKTWKIWAANFEEGEEVTEESDKWVLIDEKNNVGTDILKTTNKYESYINLSIGCTEPYEYFKIVVEAGGGDLIQMNEFTFYNLGNLNEYREEFIAQVEDFDPEERPAYIGYINEYKEKYQTLLGAVNPPDVMKAFNDMKELQDLISNSADLYEDYESLVEELEVTNIESETLAAWQESYLNDNEGPGSKFIRGTHDYINETLYLDNDGITAEKDYLQWIINAVNDGVYILLDGHTRGQWGDGFYGHLIDGIALNSTEIDPETGEEKEVLATKWGGQADPNGDTYIIFRTIDPVNPFFYTLTTGNDTGKFPGRNWGTWYIYGANFEGDGDATKDAEGWVLIDSKENVGQDRLHPVNAEPSYFGFSTETTEEYLYYKVVVTKAYSGDAIQMNELHFGTEDEFNEIKEQYTAEANEFEYDIVAEQALIDEYEETVGDISECTNMEVLFRINFQLAELRDKITASAAVYARYEAAVEAAKAYLEENTLAESEALTIFSDYLTLGAGEEPSELYPNGPAAYVLDEHVLADSVVLEEIEFLESLKTAAVAAGYGKGTDISSLIVNRTFKKAGESLKDEEGNNIGREAEGWTGNIFRTDTDDANTNEVYAAEFCNELKTFDVSQTLSDMKNGFYKVTLNAGFRPNGDLLSYNYAAMAYANDVQTYIPVVREATVEAEDEAYRGSYAPDRMIYNEDSTETFGWGIWGCEGAAHAFAQGRYAITLVAQVTDGTLTIGVKNEGTKDNEWTAVGNFGLVYLGEEEADAAEALQEAADYNAARITTLTELYEALAEAEHYSDAPNFGAAQKEALAANSGAATFEAEKAIGETMQAIYEAKQAYLDLFNATGLVYEKWFNYAGNDDAETAVYDVWDNLDEGAYADAEAAKAAKAELYAEYPSYLEIKRNATTGEETKGTNVDIQRDGFELDIVTLGVNPSIELNALYEALAEDETVLAFDYTAEQEIAGGFIYYETPNLLTEVKEEFAAMPAAAEWTTAYVNVTKGIRQLGFGSAANHGIFWQISSTVTKDDELALKARNFRFITKAQMLAEGGKALNGETGDLNGDAVVDIADAVSVLNIMAEDGFSADADINGDGKVDIADFVSILNIMAEQ